MLKMELFYSLFYNSRISIEEIAEQFFPILNGFKASILIPYYRLLIFKEERK